MKRDNLLNIGEKLTVTFTDTTILGSGVARVGDAVVFADGGVEGDTAEITVTEVKKNYAKAKIEKITSPSPHRCKPDCPVYARCGGCSFRSVGYEYEKTLKERAVSAAFRRLSLGEIKVESLVSPVSERYRNKAVLHFDRSGNLGCYEPSSHSSVFPADFDCKLHPTAFAEIIGFAKDCFGKSAVKPTYIYLRSGVSGIAVTVGLTDGKPTPEIRTFADAVMAKYGVCGVFVGSGKAPEDGEIKPIAGEAFITDKFSGLTMQVSPAAFYQVNHDAAEMLANKAAEYADAKAGELIADLYCGTGILGMVTAKKAPDAEVVGVEINASAVRNAKANAKANGIDNITFHHGDSKDFAVKIGSRTLDCAIIDPPRAGCSPEMTAELLRLSPKRIVYVSCNPSTLARDLGVLIEGGYKPIEATPFDLFPRTEHVETVVLLGKATIQDNH